VQLNYERRRAYVLPRQIAMYIARQLTGASLHEIGSQFGNRHDTTVLHSINKIERMRRSGGALDSAIRRLMNEICVRLASNSRRQRLIIKRHEVAESLTFLGEHRYLQEARAF
jgi:hypothetical protein